MTSLVAILHTTASSRVPHFSSWGVTLYSCNGNKQENRVFKNAPSSSKQSCQLMNESLVRVRKKNMKQVLNLSDLCWVWQGGNVFHWNLLSVHFGCDVRQKLWLVFVVNYDHHHRVIAVRDPKPFEGLWDLQHASHWKDTNVLSVFTFVQVIG